MARPSSILIALQAERLIKTYDFTETSMLRGLRVVGRIPGGLDRPRPGARRPFGRTHGERDLARPRQFRVGTRRTQA